MLHHAFVGSEGVRTLVDSGIEENLNETSQANNFNHVADSACDVARCQLSNQLSEPALSANPAVHLQGDPALSGRSTRTHVLTTVDTTCYFLPCHAAPSHE